MITVKFLKEWRSPTGRFYKAGELAGLTEEEANKLVAEKIAERRDEPGPREFKDKEEPEDPNEVSGKPSKT